jgi:hypothetical protein
MPDGSSGIALAYYRLCPAQWSTDPNAARGYFFTHPNVMDGNGKYGKYSLIDSNSDGTADSYPLSIINQPSEFLMMMDSTPAGSTPYRPSELNTFVQPLLKWPDINPGNTVNTAKMNRWFNMN